MLHGAGWDSAALKKTTSSHHYPPDDAGQEKTNKQKKTDLRRSGQRLRGCSLGCTGSAGVPRETICELMCV